MEREAKPLEGSSQSQTCGDAKSAAPVSQPSAGPWQIRDHYTLAGRRAVIANIDGEYIDGRAECTFDVVAVCEDEFGDSLPNAEANARLIAAAPELLEALKCAEAYIAVNWRIKTEWKAVVERARAAIAKAVQS